MPYYVFRRSVNRTFRRFAILEDAKAKLENYTNLAILIVSFSSLQNFFRQYVKGSSINLSILKIKVVNVFSLCIYMLNSLALIVLIWFNGNYKRA
jgi:hypothetical protein